jgi:hypothetical protein
MVFFLCQMKLMLRGFLISFKYDYLSQTETIKLEGELVGKAILEDVRTKGIKFFDNFGGVK